MSPLATSLWITLIGMGLVFVAILLLWGLMDLLMRFTARFAADEVVEGETESQNSESKPAGQENKQQAAAAAVAFALAMQPPGVQTARFNPAGRASHPLSEGSASHPLSEGSASHPLSEGSAWQAITRSSQLNHATHIPRKTRGSVR